MTERRTILPSGKHRAAIALALVVLLAGCSGLGLGDSGDSEAVEQVPDGVDGVAFLSGDIVTDEATEELMNGFIDFAEEFEEADEIDEDDPESWEELLVEVENETDIDVSGFGAATMFFKEEGLDDDLDDVDPEDEYVGVIIESDWSWEEFDEAAEEELDAEFEEDSYNGVTVRITEEDGEELWIADYGDGTFVAGTDQAVMDAIDTREGDHDAWGGELRDAYESAEDGLMKMAIDVPTDDVPDDTPEAGAGFGDDLVPEIEIMTMVYHTQGTEMNMDFEMTTPDAQEAESAAENLENALGTLELVIEGSDDPMFDAAGPFLDGIEISHDENRLLVNFDITVEEILDALDELAALGMGADPLDASTPAPATP